MVTVDKELVPVIKRAAAQESRPMAGYLRAIVIDDLKQRGLVNAEGKPIETTEEQPALQ